MIELQKISSKEFLSNLLKNEVPTFIDYGIICVLQQCYEFSIWKKRNESNLMDLPGYYH